MSRVCILAFTPKLKNKKSRAFRPVFLTFGEAFQQAEYLIAQHKKQQHVYPCAVAGLTRQRNWIYIYIYMFLQMGGLPLSFIYNYICRIICLYICICICRSVYITTYKYILE